MSDVDDTRHRPRVGHDPEATVSIEVAATRRRPGRPATRASSPARTTPVAVSPAGEPAFVADRCSAPNDVRPGRRRADARVRDAGRRTATMRIGRRTVAYDPDQDVSTIAGDEPAAVGDGLVHVPGVRRRARTPSRPRCGSGSRRSTTRRPSPRPGRHRRRGQRRLRGAVGHGHLPGSGRFRARPDRSFEITEVDPTASSCSSREPEIDSGGTPTFTPAADTPRLAEITVRAVDDGGTAYPSGIGRPRRSADDTSDSVTFTIAVDAEGRSSPWTTSSRSTRTPGRP